MNKIFAIMAVLVLPLMGTVSQADVFNLGEGFTNLETVTVGDPGNAGELSGWGNYERICGSVGYTYNIGKYEVTAKQYTDFLNAAAKTDPYGLYNILMDAAANADGCNIKRTGLSGNYSYSVASDYANRPVNYVDFLDACRFVNWLGNGQGTGSTETGAYTLNGYRDSDGRTIQRNLGWKWAVPTEDEWYKAAYYKGGGTDADYWDYPTQSDSTPSNEVTDPDGGNNGNFANIYQNSSYTIGSPYYRTNVGEFEYSESAYGTFDQGGNMDELNETIISQDNDNTSRGVRGGSFRYYFHSLKASSRSNGYTQSSSSNIVGFRVVSWAPVPEPSSILAMLSGLAGLSGIALRRRR